MYPLMKRNALALMLFGFIAAFLVSALTLLKWLAVLRSVVAAHTAHLPIPVGDHVATGRYLFVAFVISFSAGTALLLRWLSWKRLLQQPIP